MRYFFNVEVSEFNIIIILSRILLNKEKGTTRCKIHIRYTDIKDNTKFPKISSYNSGIPCAKLFVTGVLLRNLKTILIDWSEH